MIKKTINIGSGILFLFIATVLAGCDVHQFPGRQDEVIVPEEPEKLVDINVELVHNNTDFYLWEHLYEPKTGKIQENYPEANVDGKHPGTTALLEGLLPAGWKYAGIRFYKKGESSNYRYRFDFTHDIDGGYDATFPVKVAPGEYEVVVWSDFNEKKDGLRFYKDDSFSSIKVDYDNYMANSDYRDTYRGHASIVVTEDGGTFTVEMRRPMAKYEFVTTDLSEFLDKETRRRKVDTRARIEEYKVIMYYSTYHPSSYSALEDRLENALPGVSYQTVVNVTGETEASLGFDYVFINDTDAAGVQVTIAVYAPDGVQVACSNQITVPLRRDHHTLMRGAFLSINNEGGIGLDPSFNGDHNWIM